MKPRIVPEPLKEGDEVRVLAISRTLGGVLRSKWFTQADVDFARSRLEGIGLRVSFGRHVMACNEHLTASVDERVSDLREAIEDPQVKCILAVSGGIGAIQLLPAIDYERLAAHAKIICGYSDVAYVLNALFAKTGLVSFYGPNFTSFMMRQHGEYTLTQFRERLFTSSPLSFIPAPTWSDDVWQENQENRVLKPNEGFWEINPGEASGAVLGGSAFCFNMLQGSAYCPSLKDAVLFIENPGEGKASLMALDSTLRSVSFQPQASALRGIVIGRYPASAGITASILTQMIRAIPSFTQLPTVANCDFGHTTPMATIPVGGRCHMKIHNSTVEISLSAE